jgi:Flp pilus assembly protein TadD
LGPLHGRINRGWALLGLGRYSEALEDINSKLRINPKDPEAYHARGNVLLRLEKKDQAAEDFGRAAKLYLENGENIEHQVCLQLLQQVRGE